jgi:hypothetical protein
MRGFVPAELPSLAVPRLPTIHPALLQQRLKQIGASEGAGVGIGEANVAVEGWRPPKWYNFFALPRRLRQLKGRI